MFNQSISIHRALAIAIAVVTVLGTCTAYGQDTLLINYQGYLTDDAGDPITGTPSMTFAIYDAGGVSKWSETHPSVQVTNGLFYVRLGSQTGMPDSVFNGEDRHLGISVDGDDEIVPRTRLTSAPGAAVSKRVVGDILTAPGTVVIESNTDDSAVVLMASGETHVIKLHPPDPCVPPDPCQPALEMVAEPDNHIIRVHPPEPCVPPEPCGPAFEVAAASASHSVKMHSPGAEPDDDTDGFQVQAGTSSMELTLYPQADGAGSVNSGVALGLDSDSGKSYFDLGSTSTTASGPGLRMYANATLGSERACYILDIPVEPLPQDPFEPNQGIGGNVTPEQATLTVVRNEPTGESTQVDMLADATLAQLTLLNGDPAGPADIILRALPDGGGQIGVNTDNPAEALDVNGTTQTTGFKMPTGAVDGRVLTSDGDGNGTWQAPSGGGSKAACADMYEGMTNLSSQVIITFPVTFTAAPHFSVTGLIKSGTYAGQMAHIPKPTPGTTSVTVTIQYWDGGAFDNVGNSVEVMLSYTAIEK